MNPGIREVTTPEISSNDSPQILIQNLDEPTDSLPQLPHDSFTSCSLSEKLNEGYLTKELPSKSILKNSVRFNVNTKILDDVSYVSADRKIPTYLEKY